MLIGIVGAPNKGKSTLFSALTLNSVEMQDYPFTTIEANEGVGYVKVKDIADELKIKSTPKKGYIAHGFRFVPVKLLDVAGLVPGAHEGKGLGNKFLNDLIPADALIQVIDLSGMTNVEGKKIESNPIDEIQFLKDELNYWIFDIIKKHWDKVRFKDILQLSSVLTGLKIGYGQVEHVIDQLGLSKKDINWDDDQIFRFAVEIRKLSKPIIVVGNKCDLPSSKKYNGLKDKENVQPISAISELTLKKADTEGLIEYVPGSNNFKVISNVSPGQQKGLDYIKGNVLTVYGSTGVQEIINKIVFEILDMIVVYPVEDEKRLSDSNDNVLPDAKIIPKGTTPYELAGLIHTDIQKGYRSAIDVRRNLMIGKDHALENGQIVKINFKK